jgi:hypothetical protein
VLTGLVVAVMLLFSANSAGATTSHHKPSKSLAAKAAGDSDRNSLHNSHRHRPHKHAKSADQAHQAAVHKAAAKKAAAKKAAAKKAAAKQAAAKKAAAHKAAAHKAAAKKAAAKKAASKNKAAAARKHTDSDGATRGSRTSDESVAASATPSAITESDGRSAVGQAVNARGRVTSTSPVVTVSPAPAATTALSKSTKSAGSITKDASGSVVDLVTTALKATSQKPVSQKPTPQKSTSLKPKSQTSAFQTSTSQAPTSQPTTREPATPQPSSSVASAPKASAQPSPSAARAVPAKGSVNVAEPPQRIGLTAMTSAGVLGWLVALLVLAIGGILIFTGTSRRGTSS